MVRKQQYDVYVRKLVYGAVRACNTYACTIQSYNQNKHDVALAYARRHLLNVSTVTVVPTRL